MTDPHVIPLRQTPLHPLHVALGGRMVDFAGWSMPVQYESIVTEHRATRTHVGLFDVSHMGRLVLPGAAGVAWLEAILSRQVRDLPAGRIRYSLVTREDGGILDDVLAYRFPDASGWGDHRGGCLLVVNASNRSTITEWLLSHAPQRGAALHDITQETTMVAVQGPAAVELAAHVLGDDPRTLRYYAFRTVRWEGVDVVVSRTGYTGEDGVELIAPAVAAQALWSALSQAEVAGQGVVRRATPAGLGARDTLRLEAAMPLYGQELGTWCDPWMAGLDFAVDLTDRSFPGSQALRAKQTMPTSADPPARRRIGLRLSGRRPARPHCPIVHDGEVIGEVTSGTFSPTLEEPIAMGYVRQDWTGLDTPLEVDVRGTLLPARVVPLPFYRRSR